MSFITILLVVLCICAFALAFWWVPQLGLPAPISATILFLLGLLVLYFIYLAVTGNAGACIGRHC